MISVRSIEVIRVELQTEHFWVANNEDMAASTTRSTAWAFLSRTNQ